MKLTLKSSTILIYPHSKQSIYAWGDRHDGMVIKSEIKRERFRIMIESVNEIM
jgi:hypothetical protein